MEESDDLLIQFADELVLDLVETEVAAEVQRRRDETALCASQITLHAEAPFGWRQAWQKYGHHPACEHCRRAARIAFRNVAPGFWILKDRKNSDRPEWWRGAIEDYIAEARPIVKVIAAAASLAEGALDAVGEISKVDLHGFEHAMPVARTREQGISFEGMNYDNSFEEPRWIASSYSDEGIVTTLYRRDSRNKINGEPEETAFFLLIEDDQLRPETTVQVGLAGGALSFIRTIEIKKGYEDRCKGEVEVPLTEMRRLLGYTGELAVLPAKVLTKQEEVDEQEEREFFESMHR